MKRPSKDIKSVHTRDPLDVLKDLDGYYLRPKGGPLVAYAGTYDDNGTEKNYVGEMYANFAMAEAYPSLMNTWAFEFQRTHKSFSGVDVFLGAQEGGKSFADKLAMHYGCMFAYPKVKEIPVSDGRPRKGFIWDRHTLQRGSNVVIVEDVANNFSTTAQLIRLILDAECFPLAIVCVLNRSTIIDSQYSFLHHTIPVYSLVRKPMPEYRQDDPHVAADIAAGNIVWKPKDPEQWARLKAAMESTSNGSGI